MNYTKVNDYLIWNLDFTTHKMIEFEQNVKVSFIDENGIAMIKSGDIEEYLGKEKFREMECEVVQHYYFGNY